MIIRKMNACFGTLDGQRVELSGGLNVISAPNESGKSTWCAFLATMLYGLDTAAREKQGIKPDRIKYAPWSGTAMSGSLDIEQDGQAITLRRWTEKASAPMQCFSATYTGTDEPVPGLDGENAGRMLTGVSRDVFERSAFVRQAGMSVSNNPELEKRIQSIVAAGEEGASYSEADKQLRQWLRHRKNGSRGALPALEQDMAETSDRLRQLRQSEEEAARIDEQIKELKQTRTTAVKTMEQARARQRKAALDELFQSRQQMRELEKKRSQAEEKCQADQDRLRASDFGGIPPEEAAEQIESVRKKLRTLEKKAEKLLPLWVSFLFLLLAVGALSAALLTPYTLPLLAVGVALVFVFVAAILSSRRKAEALRNRREELLRPFDGEEENLSGMLEQYEQLWEQKRQSDHLLAQLDSAVTAARERQKAADDRLVEGLDFSKGNSEAARAGRAVEEIDEHIAELGRRRAVLEGRAKAVGDAVALGSELAVQEQRRTELQEQCDALNLAIEVMTQADTELQSRVSPLLAAKAEEYFRYLTGERYDEITLSRNLQAKARISGDVVGHEMSCLSEGTGDQLYLAVRLAVCELALPAEKNCPMVLDDALVNFDQNRMEKALKLLSALSEKRQILLFSCHEREKNYFENNPTDTVRFVGI